MFIVIHTHTHIFFKSHPVLSGWKEFYSLHFSKFVCFFNHKQILFLQWPKKTVVPYLCLKLGSFWMSTCSHIICLWQRAFFSVHPWRIYIFFLVTIIRLGPIFTWGHTYSRQGMLSRSLNSLTFKRDWNCVSDYTLSLIASGGTQISLQILLNLERSFNTHCVMCPHPICRLQKQISFSPHGLPLPCSFPTPHPLAAIPFHESELGKKSWVHKRQDLFLPRQ